MSEHPRPGQIQPAMIGPRAPMRRDPAEDWQVLGDTFEAMGKVGLAMTVGFSVAALFCRMVDSGKIKIPSVVKLMTHQDEEAPAPSPNSTVR